MLSPELAELLEGLLELHPEERLCLGEPDAEHVRGLCVRFQRERERACFYARPLQAAGGGALFFGDEEQVRQRKFGVAWDAKFLGIVVVALVRLV